MPPYFYLLDTSFFLETALPTLAACQRGHTFAPLIAVLPFLRIPAGDYSILGQAEAMPFDRHVLQAVVGQVLIFGARDMPRLPLDPPSVVALLAPDQFGHPATDRSSLAPIQQVFWGSRDLMIGNKAFRPYHVGWNNADDVRRLSNYLESVVPDAWSPEALLPVPTLPQAEDRAEELALIRDWWPELVSLYRRAYEERGVVVCEEV